jgi:hypothetical protein
MTLCGTKIVMTLESPKLSITTTGEWLWQNFKLSEMSKVSVTDSSPYKRGSCEKTIKRLRYFDTEDGGSIFLRIAGIHLEDY